MARYLSEHNALPYAPDLEYIVDILMTILCRYMDYKTMKRMFKVKSSDPYVFWMYLWETFGDPAIPLFPKELIPPVAVDTSSDEITPPAPIAPIDHVPATDASDLVQQDPLCLPTLPSSDDDFPPLQACSWSLTLKMWETPLMIFIFFLRKILLP